MIYLFPFLFFSHILFAQNNLDKEDSSGTDYKSILGYSLVPLVPPSILLAKKPEIRNRKNVRKAIPSIGIQAFSGSQGSSIGYFVEYPITRDLDFWSMGIGQNTYQWSTEDAETQSRIYATYKMYPYRKSILSTRLEGARWSYKGESDSSVSISFYIQHQLSNWLSIYYSPNYIYFSNEKDLSEEISLGFIFPIGKLRLQVGGIYFMDRKGRDNELLASFNIGVAI